ncbi:MAG: hypothetical protein AMK69_20810 [Nitrospira bacterium SG8_3]|nr:MAG: hypothetical protein AMK69_20810 [Nitrospira bacterium SG8_3]
MICKFFSEHFGITNRDFKLDKWGTPFTFTHLKRNVGDALFSWEGDTRGPFDFAQGKQMTED